MINVICEVVKKWLGGYICCNTQDGVSKIACLTFGGGEILFRQLKDLALFFHLAGQHYKHKIKI